MDIHLDSTSRPRVHVFCAKNKEYGDAVEQVCLGIEEEGIPYIVEYIDNPKSAVHLAYKAAESSRLGVGIGIADGVVLHYIKLLEDQPLYNIESVRDTKFLRTLGTNAARLVKGSPFKEIEE